MGDYGTMKWFIVQNKYGKYADGYYGWDSCINDYAQIFSEDELPYIPNSDMAIIFVVQGEKPTPHNVAMMLKLDIKALKWLVFSSPPPCPI